LAVALEGKIEQIPGDLGHLIAQFRRQSDFLLGGDRSILLSYGTTSSLPALIDYIRQTKFCQCRNLQSLRDYSRMIVFNQTIVLAGVPFHRDESDLWEENELKGKLNDSGIKRQL
jgi:hypothetical protein